MNARKYLSNVPSVAVFDPSIATRNVGDEIIVEAVCAELDRLMPDLFRAHLPTHEKLGLRSWRFAHQSTFGFVAGSNILSDRLPFDRQWRLRPQDLALVRNLVLVGVGWRAYGERSRPWSQALLQRLLSKDAVHSVRDEMTKNALAERGIENVVNTSCVTMWGLDVGALADLPRRPSPRVVTTINAGHFSDGDLAVLDVLLENYDEVFLWPQGIDDVPIVRELKQSRGRLKLIGPTLGAYDAILASGSIDFVGNRLHGGIRAMQFGRRATIISVDNRASEIAKDTRLPVVELADGLSGLVAAVRQPDPIELDLPVEAISEWRAQFEGTSFNLGTGRF